MPIEIFWVLDAGIWIPWSEWKAARLNALFDAAAAARGLPFPASRITAATIRHGVAATPAPVHSAMARGFVSDARFAGAATDQVIKRTNRQVTRKWRALG